VNWGWMRWMLTSVMHCKVLKIRTYERAGEEQLVFGGGVHLLGLKMAGFVRIPRKMICLWEC